MSKVRAAVCIALIAAVVFSFAMLLVGITQSAKERAEESKLAYAAYSREVGKMRDDLAKLKSEQSALGAIIEFRNGELAMVLEIDQHPYGYIKLSKRKMFPDTIGPESPDREIASILRIYRSNDPEYPEKKQEFFLQK
ncbi:MAG TPA: hypothetical protein VGP13_03360 [Candidatus Paceibacterota bacterium]|jgi:hypothetical protein|nr:hypothetical protein [Candidatus Paceibacterota bacterium]